MADPASSPKANGAASTRSGFAARAFIGVWLVALIAIAILLLA